MKNNIDKDDLKNQKKQCTTKPIANWAVLYELIEGVCYTTNLIIVNLK